MLDQNIKTIDSLIQSWCNADMVDRRGAKFILDKHYLGVKKYLMLNFYRIRDVLLAGMKGKA